MRLKMMWKAAFELTNQDFWVFLRCVPLYNIWLISNYSSKIIVPACPGGKQTKFYEHISLQFYRNVPKPHWATFSISSKGNVWNIWINITLSSYRFILIRFKYHHGTCKRVSHLVKLWKLYMKEYQKYAAKICFWNSDYDIGHDISKIIPQLG